MALAAYQSNRSLVSVFGFKTSLLNSGGHLQVERQISWLKKYLFSWTWEEMEDREQKYNLGNKSSILSDVNW